MTQYSNQKFRSPKAAYIGYLFQTFLKRPFGYIIAALYIIYLLTILVIVPSALHFEPLFIWNIGGFNMPIFNLFFIAASTASIAVAMFRTGRDDGSDLNISAKPLTKISTVFIKTSVYLLIMLIICLITTAIVAFIKPIFGSYNEITNITGITDEKYRGILLSVLIGNLIAMLFFGGISVFISMIGGQVITIIGSVAIVFIMCILNLLFPIMVKSSLSVLSDKYDADMLGYSCNTLHQYNHPEEDQSVLNFATIQCTTNDSGIEEFHYDTKEYWDIAEKESGKQATNYIDIGGQLSTLFTSFGLNESKLKEASKLVIGVNGSYIYNIDQKTHITVQDNIDEQNYPIAYYTIRKSLGKTFPWILIVGGDMTLTTNNWYLYSTLFGIDFESVNYISTKTNDIAVVPSIWDIYKRPFRKMKDLTNMTSEQKEQAKQLYADAAKDFDPKTHTFTTFTYQYIKDYADKFNFDTPQNTYDSIAKIHLVWAIEAQANQIQDIQNYFINKGMREVKFPYNSQQFLEWYTNRVDTGLYKNQSFNSNLYSSGIAIDDDTSPSVYSRLSTSKMDYAETFANLYRYSVTSFYKLSTLIPIWAIISCCFFAVSVIVYKRTDFK